jgi:hypothetical protein
MTDLRESDKVDIAIRKIKNLGYYMDDPIISFIAEYLSGDNNLLEAWYEHLRNSKASDTPVT